MAERPFPLDFSGLEPDRRPRRWLVLPPGFTGKADPDAVSPVFEQGPEAVLEAFRDTALSASRTQLTNEGGGQLEFVQKSAVFKFPDYITVAAVAVEGGTGLCVYSRAAVGRYDFNVNRKRVEAWLEETGRRLEA